MINSPAFMRLMMEVSWLMKKEGLEVRVENGSANQCSPEITLTRGVISTETPLPSRATQFPLRHSTFPNLNNLKILQSLHNLLPSSTNTPSVSLSQAKVLEGCVELHSRRVKPVSKSGVLWLAWLACLCVSPPRPLLISQGARRR
jgi:hypothetical protein